MFHQRARDRPNTFQRHQEYQRALGPSQRRPVHGRALVARRHVNRDHLEVLRRPPVGHGQARGGRHADCAADAGNHGHRHASAQAGEHLLAAPPEDERVTALEPDHELSTGRVRDQCLVDLLLRHLPPVRHLAGVDDDDIGRQFGKQFPRPEPVGDHDVRLGEELPAPDRNEVRVPRAAADKGHSSAPPAVMAGGDRPGGDGGIGGGDTQRLAGEMREIEPEHRVEIGQRDEADGGRQLLVGEQFVQNRQRLRGVEIVRHRLVEPLAIGRCIALRRRIGIGGRAVAQRRDGHHQTLQSRHRRRQPLAGEFQLAAIVRRQAHQAIGEGMDALVDQALERGEAAGGFRHLSRAFDQEVVVHPPVGAGLGAVAMRLVLGDLVGVVDFAMVDAAGVDVELFAEIFLAHYRAFEMPARRAAAPGRIPLHLPVFARRGLAPDREILGVALAGDRLDPARRCVVMAAGERAVVRHRRDVEIEAAVELVAMLRRDRFREGDHVADMVGGD